MNSTLLLLCDGLLGPTEIKIPWQGLTIMFCCSLFLLWFKNIWRPGVPLNLRPEGASIIAETDVLGFQKSTENFPIMHASRSMKWSGRLLALLMIIVFFCVPAYFILGK